MVSPKGGAADCAPFTIIRGYLDCPYHADILAKFERDELPEFAGQWEAECPGGGRIETIEADKRIFIYGYSQGFGRCDHEVTQALVREAYPEYDVTWSNEGY